jgi:spermidine synthase-like protein
MMWPGQAMSTKFFTMRSPNTQDVLVFESSDYGTVLVLDNIRKGTSFRMSDPIPSWGWNVHFEWLTMVIAIRR